MTKVNRSWRPDGVGGETQEVCPPPATPEAAIGVMPVRVDLPITVRNEHGAIVTGPLTFELPLSAGVDPLTPAQEAELGAEVSDMLRAQWSRLVATQMLASMIGKGIR